MEKRTNIHRGWIVFGAVLIQMSLGAIYIYSVFKPALARQFPTWSATDLALPSQLVLACFALSTIFAGRIQDKLGPRKVAIAGGMVLGLGLLIASVAQDLTTFVLGFSVMGGIGIGAAYVCPIATCVKWFPDKRGFITGLAVAGFGAGALVFTPVAKWLIADPHVGIMKTFLYLGAIFCLSILVGATLMKNPEPGWCPAGWRPPAPRPGGQPGSSDCTWREMLRRPPFWLAWITYFAGCTAGLLVIMNTTNIWQSISLLQASHWLSLVPKATYEEIVSQGQNAVMVVAVFNSIGRIIWGKISDVWGRPQTLFVIFLIAGAAMLILNWMTSYALFLAAVGIVGFCFGGFLALFPAISADNFGTRNVGVNYGLLFTAYGAGGLCGPWLAPRLMHTTQTIPVENLVEPVQAGLFLNAFVISGALCLVSAIIILTMKGKATVTTST